MICVMIYGNGKNGQVIWSHVAPAEMSQLPMLAGNVHTRSLITVCVAGVELQTGREH